MRFLDAWSVVIYVICEFDIPFGGNYQPSSDRNGYSLVTT